MFKIGDFSKFSRISVKMLRHYDEIGLFKPAYVDPETSYRYYSADQLPRLNRIIALKDLGFSLEQIGQLVDDGLSTEQLRGMLKLRRAEIEQQLRQSQAQLDRVEARLRDMEQAAQVSPYDVVLRRVAPQTIASIRQVIPWTGDLIGPLFEQLEAYVAGCKARALGPPLTIYHDAEYDERGLDVEVAVPITDPVPPTDQITSRELAGVAHMACVVHTGSYTTTDRAYNVLLNWLAGNDFTIAGPTRVVYLRFGANNDGYELPAAYLTNQAAAYVTEIQLPVEKR